LDILYYAQSNSYGDATLALGDLAYAAFTGGLTVYSISGTSNECEGAYSVATTP